MKQHKRAAKSKSIFPYYLLSGGKLGSKFNASILKRKLKLKIEIKIYFIISTLNAL